MNEIGNYFEPLASIKPSFNFGSEKGYISDQIVKNNYANCQIALIGVTETRNSFQKIQKTELKKIREYFYSLASFQRLKIADLGNLKTGNNVVDTYASIEFVTNYLINKNIIPVFFGGTQDLSVSIFKALKEKAPECVIIDSRFDIDKNEFHSKNFISELLNIYNEETISIVGYQSYFVSSEQNSLVEKLNIQQIRLGLIRNNFSFVEPYLRDADFVSFDLSSLRQSDLLATTFPSPNGFYSEEACQLANLSGLSDKLKVFFITEYDSTFDENGNSAHSIAQLLWHFLYGVSQRKGDYPAQSITNYKKIYVKVDKPDTELVFYQNPTNKRYWIEIPTNKKDEAKIIACTEKDYRSTCMGEIPDRIWKAISKYF